MFCPLLNSRVITSIVFSSTYLARLHKLSFYTPRQKLSNTILFGYTVLEVAERNMWIMKMKYFEVYCKFYYFYEHLELKMILSIKYLDNLRPFTKPVKNDKEKQWKKFEVDVWKIRFGLTCNRMESYHPEHLLFYYKFLKKNYFYGVRSQLPVYV